MVLSSVVVVRSPPSVGPWQCRMGGWVEVNTCWSGFSIASQPCDCSAMTDMTIPGQVVHTRRCPLVCMCSVC